MVRIEDLKELPLAERIQLVEDLWDSIAQESSALSLSPEHRDELDRRLDDLESDARGGVTWEEYKRRAEQRE